jgi:hypothetical protein
MTRVGLEEISVCGIQLVREGDYAVVKVERLMADGTHQWREVIHEHVDGAFGHIVEPGGILSKFSPYEEQR